MLVIISLEGSHFRYMESMPVSQQNSQISKEVGVDISAFLGSSVLYWHIAKQSTNCWQSLQLQSSTFDFLYECFLRVSTWIVSFPPMQLWHTMSSLLYIIKNGLPQISTWFPPTPSMHLKYKNPGFCTLIQAWSISSWRKVTEFVDLKSQRFFWL